MKFSKKLVALAALMLLTGSLSFAATLANGTFSFNSTGGIISYNPPGLLVDAVTVSLPAPTGSTGCGIGGVVCMQVSNVISPTFNGKPNTFNSSTGLTPLNINDDVTFSSYVFDLTFSSMPVFYFTNQNGNRFTFTATHGAKGAYTIGGSDFLNVGYTGMFSDSGGTYSPNLATLSLTFTQASGVPDGAVNFAGTFSTTSVPEPTTMALLGSALLGLGLIGRKRTAR